jgi:hypothetical protein
LVGTFDKRCGDDSSHRNILTNHKILILCCFWYAIYIS